MVDEGFISDLLAVHNLAVGYLWVGKEELLMLKNLSRSQNYYHKL